MHQTRGATYLVPGYSKLLPSDEPVESQCRRCRINNLYIPLSNYLHDSRFDESDNLRTGQDGVRVIKNFVYRKGRTLQISDWYICFHYSRNTIQKPFSGEIIFFNLHFCFLSWLFVFKTRFGKGFLNVIGELFTRIDVEMTYTAAIVLCLMGITDIGRAMFSWC